jgi:nitroreductase
MKKLATNEFPILDVLRERWSPRAYADKPIDPDKVWSLLEAARWSPSGGNEQPWSFIVAFKGDAGFDKIVAALMGNNQKWVPQAPVLIVNIAKLTRSSGAPNRHAHYDVGQAVAHMTVQAGALGLHTRQIGGFDAEQIRQAFGIPDGYEPVTITAVGEFGDLDRLPDDLRQRESGERVRKPFEEIVFSERFGQPARKPEKAARV